MFTHDALVALRQETSALSVVLHTLDPAQFDRPTNCPPWDLRELVVHTAASVRTAAPYRRPIHTRCCPARPTTTAARNATPGNTGSAAP
jgi:Mycothiol maleylpyruvate isomerase N-terminal domain